MSVPPEARPQKPSKSAIELAQEHLQKIQALKCPFWEECGVAQGILDGTITVVTTCQGESEDPYWKFRCHYDLFS